MKLDLPDYVCCICGKEFTGWGNNPYPVVKTEDARCCDKCNDEKVIPARILAMYKEEKRNDKERSN